jgi:hypothetical protein
MLKKFSPQSIQSVLLIAVAVISFTLNPASGQVTTRKGKSLAGKGRVSGKQAAMRNGFPGTVENWSQAEALARPFVEEKSNGKINWTEQFIEAKGQAVIDNERFKNAAQARLMAQRGAIVVAQRNLLEIIKGVNVTSETTVEDMITTKDYIYSRIDGVVKGARMVGEPMVKEGFIEVQMRVSIYEGNGVAQAVYDDLPDSLQNQENQGTIENNNNQEGTGKGPEGKSEKLKSDSAGKDQNPVLFAINNSKNWNPSMFPVIMDEQGKAVLDLSKIYDPTKGKFPKVMGLTKEIFDAAGWKKGSSVVDLIIKDGKLTIPTPQKNKVNWSKVFKTMGDIGRFVLKLL